MKTKKLEIPSDPDRLPQVDQFAQKVARGMGFSKEECDDISIAVTEIVNNAITHGNNADPRKMVVIVFKMEENRLAIMVQDQGNGFTPEEVADPTLPENIFKIKGRGIFLVKHLMDRVSFSKNPQGMLVALVKYKQPVIK